MDEVDTCKDLNLSIRSYRQLMVLGGIGNIFFSIVNTVETVKLSLLK